MNAVKYLIENWEQVLAAVIALMTGVIAVAALIPGDQPEKSLMKIVAFLSKFSRKPKPVEPPSESDPTTDVKPTA